MTARSQPVSSLPERVGTLRVSARHLHSAGVAPSQRSHAGAGGDVYGVVESPFGTRLLMGDVMGKGHELARTADSVLRAWRDLAVCEARLEGVAVRLHALVAHSDEPDRFVTATLLSVEADGSAQLVCCGHPPPVLLRDGAAVHAAVPAPAPPLGLLDLHSGWCAAQPVPATAWECMLLYTDGVSEARDARGVFYPLAERAAVLPNADLDDFTDALAADLLRHAEGGLQDDASLLAVRSAA
ncbi:PP2C family protein-serine/threonine phosphatase [Streptomyces sp. NPDC058067]|uniref:PP2C family protein-serine/threonine phosphatase n=1 Tax=Streptomyces sp. NPDC058067 TaxID=3346324 RepID=UPI0036EBF961